MLIDKSNYYTREALSLDNSNTVKSYFDSTLLNHLEEIINMINYLYSNGSMERTNSIIKQSKNAAFGFSNLVRTTKLIQYRIN